MDKMQAQKEEFNALIKLWQAYKAMPAVVDDDYPEYRHYYEKALQEFIEAIIVNGRISAGTHVTFNEESKHNKFLWNVHTAIVEKTRKPGSAEDIRFLSFALFGEVGELANLIKKDWRGDNIPHAEG